MMESALFYRTEMDFSVIPVGVDKKPLIKWEEFQKRKATDDEIKAWWIKHPGANIGIVTGEISGIDVFDVDTEQGKEAIEELTPETLLTPIASTPRGGEHRYFIHTQGVRNATGVIPGVDIRGDGGYIIAPPSRGPNGSAYKWVIPPRDAKFAPLPDTYRQFLPPNGFPRTPFLNPQDQNLIGDLSRVESNSVSKKHTSLQFVTSSYTSLQEGERDQGLFHAANCLIKGGMDERHIIEILEVIAGRCNPPFPMSELQSKLKSAMGRAQRRERNISQEVREWVLVTSRQFFVTNVYSELHLVTKEEKGSARSALVRIKEEGLIEEFGEVRGSYRRTDKELEEIDWINAPTEEYKIRLPFGLNEYVKVFPGNLIVVAGEVNAGKTGFLLNVTKDNMQTHDIWYFSSEMKDIEFKERLSLFGDPPLSKWNFHAIHRPNDPWDVIQPDGFNIVDYLEIHEDFYKVGKMMKSIFDKLKKGIAIVALQKNPGAPTGLGGFRGLEKPRLYLNIESHPPNKNVLRIAKAKNWRTEYGNPNGKTLEFNLLCGAKLHSNDSWHYEEEKIWKSEKGQVHYG